MSIAPQPARAHRTGSPDRRRLLALCLAAAALLAVALAVRLVLLVRSDWLLDGDDALSALMALGIRAGDRPIMLKNQTYAAAWEPYMMAVSYAVGGVSRVSAKVPALVGSLALIPVSALLAREVGGKTAAWFTATLVALPPVYVLVMTLKPWAPYTEVMLAGSVALLSAIRVGFPAPRRRDTVWTAACGVAGGVAFSMHPVAIWYLVPCALLVVARVSGTRLLRCATIGVWAFLVGACPVLVYNWQTGGATIQFVARGVGGQPADRLAVLSAWWHGDLPRGAGLWYPWGPSPEPATVVAATVIVAAVVWAVFARRRPCWRGLDGVLLLLAAIPVVFVLSGFGGPALNPYGFDATGRYAPPIWNALAVILGCFFAAAWRWRRWLGAALAAVTLLLNVFQWASADPVAAFQSPYWPRLTRDNGPLLATLREESVTRIWLNHWAGLPLMFDARAAGQDLVAYDWYDVQAGGIDRFPEYRPLVEAAGSPAYVLVTDEPRPELAARLDDLGVAYAQRRVPPYVVVIPRSRAVHPSEVTGALDYRY